MPGRDTSKRLPVIDGPCKGQRVAQEGDSYTFEIASSNKTKAIFTYYLRRHRMLGLVWALPANKTVAPVNANKQEA